jgi:hypothetical protein
MRVVEKPPYQTTTANTPDRPPVVPANSKGISIRAPLHCAHAALLANCRGIRRFQHQVLPCLGFRSWVIKYADLTTENELVSDLRCLIQRSHLLVPTAIIKNESFMADRQDTFSRSSKTLPSRESPCHLALSAFTRLRLLYN